MDLRRADGRNLANCGYQLDEDSNDSKQGQVSIEISFLYKSTRQRIYVRVRATFALMMLVVMHRGICDMDAGMRLISIETQM